MDTDSIIYAALFIWGIFFSGWLAAIRNSFGIFKKFQDRIDDPEKSKILSDCVDLWKKEGFTELLSLSRYILDALVILSGSLWVSLLLEGKLPYPLSLALGLLLAILISYSLSHQIMPYMGQAMALKLAKPMYIFFSAYWILWGWAGKIISGLNNALLKNLGFHGKFKIVTEEDLKKSDTVEPRFGSSGLEDEEVEMVQNIFNIENMKVKEIFTPRVDTIAVELNSNYEEVIDVIRTHMFTRIPVYHKNIDDIRGILHVKDLLLLDQKLKEENFTLEAIIRPAYFIPRSKKIKDLMEEFKKDHNHIAIVVDEYGGTAGLITMEDILEEIVGEIQDEDDVELPKIIKMEENAYIIDPIILLEEVNKEIELNLKPDEKIDIDTLGGYLQYLRGSVPSEGDIISTNGCEFKILKMEGQSIEKVKLVVSQAENQS